MKIPNKQLIHMNDCRSKYIATVEAAVAESAKWVDLH